MRVVLVLLAALVLLPGAHAGPTQVERYVGAGDIATLHSALGAGLLEARLNVGGAVFQGPGDERGVTVRVDDAVVGHDLTLVACQDVDGSGLCDGGEPSAGGCGLVTLGAPEGYVAGVPVVVSVEAQGALRGGCELPAAPTSGTLAATFN